MLTANPRSDGRRYVCHSRHGCGKLTINADMVEKYVFDFLLPVADSPVMRDVLRSENEDVAKKAQALVLANSQDQAMLSQLEDDYADKVVTRQAFLRQSQRLSERIEARDAQLATLRGHSALDRLGDDVQANWDSMSADDKRSIIQSLVAHIEIKSVLKHGYNRFDPDRVNIVFRSEQFGKVLVGLLGSKDRITWRKAA